MRTTAIVAAAGQGKRMGSGIPKQYLELDNKPILVHTLLSLQAVKEIDEMILVIGDGEKQAVEHMIAAYGITKATKIVTGGKERQHSVKNGLDEATGDLIAVHDGARPLIKKDAVTRLIQTAQKTGAAILAVPVKDTIKEVNHNGQVIGTPERRTLWAVQTPQVFHREILERAYAKAEQDNYLGTDESSLVERIGYPVTVVEGDYENIKITTPEDMEIAQTFMRKGE